MIERIEELVKTIKLVYKNASDKRKKFIKDWIDGIVIDKNTRRKNQVEPYLSGHFDEDKIVVITDDDNDKRIKLNDLYENETEFLLTYLYDLYDELGR